MYNLFHRSILLPMPIPKREFYQERQSCIEMRHRKHTWTTSTTNALCSFETKTITTLSQNVCLDLFLNYSKGQICRTMSSFLLCCKTKTVIWQEKKQKSYYLLYFEIKNIYSKKWTHFLMRIFFRYEWETDVKKIDE